MTITLPSDTPQNIAIAFNESQRILDEVFQECQLSYTKYKREIKIRKYLAYSLKIISVIGAVFITAGYIPHQLAIAIAVIYGIETALSNNKRLISIKTAQNAYTAIKNRVMRTHQVEQGKLFANPNQIEMIEKITSLNINLSSDAHNDFKIIEQAVNDSDIAILQALSLDEEKLNLARKNISHNS